MTGYQSCLLQNILQGVDSAQTDIDGLPDRVLRFKQAPVGSYNIAYITEIPGYIQVPQFDELGAAARMRNYLGNQELLKLTNARVVERARDDQWQLPLIQPRQIFHCGFADRVIIGGRKRGRLVQHTFGVAIDIGTAGKNDCSEAVGNRPQCFEQVSGADEIGAVNGVSVGMR